jgi:hypothetical protein
MNIKNLNSMRLERQSFLFLEKAPKDKRQRQIFFLQEKIAQRGH